MKRFRDYVNTLETSKEKGRKEGIEIGANLKAIETAKKFLSMGLSVEEVAEGTGLSIAEVEKLVKH
ncbi:hypothetical protein IC221_24540 [Flammeovirga sp. EKP202]|nr:hypothetical protein [Flammeovirga sp. EKP202]